MKPVAIFQHTPLGAPGTVVPILEALGHPVQIVRVLEGEPVPADASAFAGLVFMGGYMGVHDDLPWIAQELALIRDAHARGLPLAGHCLGSQLVALALGGTVAPNARPEIGWNPLDLGDDAVARDWLGPFAERRIEAFQWHGDTFTPPAGAAPLASAPHCANQMFVLDDRHLLVQSHLEMTPELVSLYRQHNGAQLERQHAAGNPAASAPEDLLEGVEGRTGMLEEVLGRLYARWVRGVG